MNTTTTFYTSNQPKKYYSMHYSCTAFEYKVIGKITFYVPTRIIALYEYNIIMRILAVEYKECNTVII